MPTRRRDPSTALLDLVLPSLGWIEGVLDEVGASRLNSRDRVLGRGC